MTIHDQRAEMLAKMNAGEESGEFTLPDEDARELGFIGLITAQEEMVAETNALGYILEWTTTQKGDVVYSWRKQ
jgi:hypothetical protein